MDFTSAQFNVVNVNLLEALFPIFSEKIENAAPRRRFATLTSGFFDAGGIVSIKTVICGFCCLLTIFMSIVSLRQFGLLNFLAVRGALLNTMAAEPPSIFTKIINGEIPSTKLHEDDKCIAIKDIDPKAPIHFLVVPKEQLKGISSATDEHTSLLGHLLMTVNKVAKAQNLEKGYRVVINDGKDGGQEVPHLHIHVLGGRQMGWPPG